MVGVRVAAALEGAGFQVVTVADTLEGLKSLYQVYPDLIIVASELPRVNGGDAYVRIRQASYIPIVVLGSQEEAAEILELGADAFMAKPPSLSELVARVRRLLQRKPGFGQMGDNSDIDRDSDPPERGNGLGYLSATEYRLASCLVLNKGSFLEYTRLIEEVWGGKHVSRDTLHFYVRRLRQKLQAYFPYPVNISNFRGMGYCLEEVRLQTE